MIKRIDNSKTVDIDFIMWAIVRRTHGEFASKGIEGN